MSSLRFTVNGKAEPKGSKTRTRWGVRDDNAKAKGYMEHVADVAAAAMMGLDGPDSFLEGPLRLELVFYRPRPSGHYNSKGELSAAGRRSPAPTTKPDALKLARGVEDALTGVVYRDDAAIVDELILKRYGEPARVEVSVAELNLPSEQ